MRGWEFRSRPTKRVADLQPGDYIEPSSLGGLLEVDHVKHFESGQVQVVLKAYCTTFANPDFEIEVP